MSFITSLRIKNFFSIKNEVTIDFKATPYNIENNPERLFEFNGEYYNKVISLYGANASGKSTVLKAITTVSNAIINQDDKQFFMSFKNKFANLEDSSEIVITFVLDIDNELQEFLYEIEFESNRFENIGIENEKLIKVEENRQELLIDRKKQVVNNIDSNVKKAIFDNLKSTKSLIQEVYKFEDGKVLNRIENFFLNTVVSSNIQTFYTDLGMPNFRYIDMGSCLSEFSWSSDLENFYLAFFNALGLDIVKIEAKYREYDTKEKEFLGIDVFHDINLKEPLEISLESDGTQMLMKVLLDIFKAKKLGSVLILDELDSIIHPMLVPIIINLLIKNDIQIIYSTHNIYNMKFLQNDEVFLIEKDENHETTIRAVKDMPDIKGYKNLLTLYENGYLGGVPKIEEIITKIL